LDRPATKALRDGLSWSPIRSHRDCGKTWNAVERIASLNGATVQEVRFQDSYTGCLEFVFDDGRVLELFSEASSDDWLLSIGDLVIEAPL
jgi:hypothetical protein